MVNLNRPLGLLNKKLEDLNLIARTGFIISNSIFTIVGKRIPIEILVISIPGRMESDKPFSTVLILG